MTFRLASLAVIVALLGAFVLAPHAARAQAPPTIDPVPVTATKNRGAKSFDGVFTATQFVAHRGNLAVQGTLTGVLTKGKRTQSVAETVLLPVAVTAEAAGGTQAIGSQANAKRVAALQPVCDVLFLQLGPITLNLLGLNVQIGGGPEGTLPIVVEITADAAGGILGSLLCSLAGGVPLNLGQLLQLIQLLNALFNLLG